ncbi:MAG: hypothetical protein ABL904_13745 [Hyphomicrobiaceae bacterium]
MAVSRIERLILKPLEEIPSLDSCWQLRCHIGTNTGLTKDRD